MAREWFELKDRDGRVEYLHSRSGIALARPAGMPDEEWGRLRSAFFERFPRAREIRKDDGAPIASVDCLPCGEAPLFSPGDRFVLNAGAPRPAKVTVVAIQMPFPGCGDPSYLLKDGRMLSWNGRTERWVLREAWGLEPAVITLPARRPRAARPDVHRQAVGP